jgi:DNA-binding LacI/PurR family transcriptional regulator
MRITIKEVAEQACVSQTTVSLVLNNAPGVSTTTREKVMRVIKETNYKPDALARSFSSRRAEAIALVFPPELDSLNDPYFMDLLRGVLEAVRDRGYKMLLEIADERFMEQRLWEDLFMRKRIDGLVVATPQLNQDYLKELSCQGHLAMLINGARPDLPELDFVGYDDVRCGIDATYYLIGLGHRRIAHLTGPDNQASALARRKGYEQALERARIPFRPEDVLPGDYRRESAEAAMKALLKRPATDRPTAIFSANDTMAIAAMSLAQDAGLVIPGDLSIIGVDDTGAAARSTPPLTTLRQDVHALSYRAVAQFIKKLEERIKECIHERIPMTLIERGTCASYEGGR